MNSILSVLMDEPRSLTYVGIGSCPHLAPKDTLEPRSDQLIPLWIREEMKTTPVRILHIDPAFPSCLEQLETYLKPFDLIPLDLDGGYRWVNHYMDFIVVPQYVSHTKHFRFFEQLSEEILEMGGSLVLQEYTGQSTEPLRARMFKETAFPELFKRRVLVDMTFGSDEGCSTDMTKLRLFRDARGFFINLPYCSQQDLLGLVGLSRDLDSILRKRTLRQFLETLNNHHVDYRRRLKDLPCMFGSPQYTNETPSDLVMAVLQGNLKPFVELLSRLHVIDQVGRYRMNELFEDYKSYDPYKWYSEVVDLVRP
jgi:hypothetical protein